MNHLIKNALSIIGFTAAILSAGCSKKIDDEITSVDFSRLFSPTAVTTTVVGGTSVNVSWAKVTKAEHYDIELVDNGNQDFSGSSVRSVKNLDATTLTYTFKSLYGETDYSFRVKAVSADTPESKWTTVTFKSGSEQIMTRVERTDLSQTSVTLKWKTPNDVSHFMIGSNKYDISASEKTAGAKTITGLTNGTQYTAKLYYNNGVRGNRSFKTYAANPTGTNVINISSAADLATQLAAAANNSILVIPQGATFDYASAIALPKDVSVTIWGEDGINRPVIALNGLNLPLAAGTIKFANVDITGLPSNIPGGTKRNYIFNQSDSTVTEAIIFDNCIVRNFTNTPVRVQGSKNITIKKVAFNNCIVYDCGVNSAGNGTYAMVHSNTATGKITNIEFTQSTFYDIGYALILHNAAASTSVKIENCTIYNTTGNARYMIDYNTFSAGTFTIKNTIIGKTLSATATANGYRAASAPIVTNSYITSDVVFAAGAIPSVINYTNNSANLFTEPAGGNFVIKDSLFAGASTAGDSRWMP
ncbi:DUF5123 domain-containing protein [Filimonas effusa]|nr:DUF5123 domain-containing protein [Filimonas effusa]